VGYTITPSEVDLLTDLGKVQANLLGTHLSTLKIDYVYSSDYGRAVQTAKGILKQSKWSSQIPIQTEKRLREVVREKQLTDMLYCLF